jgi:hypothetical protein
MSRDGAANRDIRYQSSGVSPLSVHYDNGTGGKQTTPPPQPPFEGRNPRRITNAKGATVIPRTLRKQLAKIKRQKGDEYRSTIEGLIQ